MKIIAIATSTRKGTPKTVVPSAELVPDHGLADDAHAGPWHRQVSLLAAESIAVCRDRGFAVDFGAFAENIATQGIDWTAVPVGSRFRLGAAAVVEITQIGKECTRPCAIFHRVGDCIMPREGVFARVLSGGSVRIGDAIQPLASPSAADPAAREWAQEWTAAGGSAPAELTLIGEEPLSIRIQGRPYTVVMRTPGDEKAHVAGFCLAEGIVDAPSDITALAFCDGGDTNVVTVTLSAERRAAVAGLMERRTYISQTSCGLCGKELVEELFQALSPVERTERIGAAEAAGSLAALTDHQPLRRRTRAAHAAALFTGGLELLTVAEDVGRHNALDKAVGTLFLDGRLAQAAVLVLSSRISYELVQKAARARLPVILAVSRPTALAVRLARRLGITLATRGPDNGLFIYCHPQRLTGR